jgi:DNA-binding NarL/FixJ family response regulator
MKIIIADDHVLFVEGLCALLEELGEVEIMAKANNGRQLLDCLHNMHPDLVLMDLNMPGLDGIETLKILNGEFPNIKVIVLTSYYQPELIRDMRSNGAKGYLLKSGSITQLKETIDVVANGGLWFTDEAPPEQSGSPFFIDDFMKKYNLTRREVEIIKMVASGQTTKSIADRLFISEFTVNAHRRNISRKLGIHTPVGLLNFAKEQGLI